MKKAIIALAIANTCGGANALYVGGFYGDYDGGGGDGTGGNGRYTGGGGTYAGTGAAAPVGSTGSGGATYSGGYAGTTGGYAVPGTTFTLPMVNITGLCRPEYPCAQHVFGLAMVGMDNFQRSIFELPRDPMFDPMPIDDEEVKRRKQECLEKCDHIRRLATNNCVIALHKARSDIAQRPLIAGTAGMIAGAAATKGNPLGAVAGAVLGFQYISNANEATLGRVKSECEARVSVEDSACISKGWCAALIGLFGIPFFARVRRRRTEQ